MSADKTDEFIGLTPRSDEAWDRFEEAWNRSESPRIEDYLAGFEGVERRALLAVLLGAEIDHRRRRNERPRAQEYVDRFASEVSLIHAMFKAAAPDIGNGDGGETGVLSSATEWTPAAEAGSSSPPTVLPAVSPFLHLKFHARGGLGEVYRARDEQLNRDVALKVIQAQRAGSAEGRRRFERESEVTGRLEHPGIAPVHVAGHCDDGRPYYVMRFIDGETLRDTIHRFYNADTVRRDSGERVLAFRGLLNRFVQVCHTVDYAHSRGVLHRDIKPANVMLGSYGETLLVDWGLAKIVGEADGGDVDESSNPRTSVDTAVGSAPGVLQVRTPDQPESDVETIDYAHSQGTARRDQGPDDNELGRSGATLGIDGAVASPVGSSTSVADGDGGLGPTSWADRSALTLPGSAHGTPGFMSPEQAAGDLDRLGPLSDIYSLGATLYCLLTGRAPFEDEKNLGVILKAVQEGRFETPRAVRPNAPPALEAVCLKAMALRPEDRYASARALAEEIESWLADEPVLAWREPPSIRARRWMRRHRTPLAAIATALLVAAALAVGVGSWLYRLRQARMDELEKTVARIQALHDRATTAGDLSLWREANAAAEPLAAALGDLKATRPGRRLAGLAATIAIATRRAEEDRSLIAELIDNRTAGQYLGGGVRAAGYVSIFRKRGLDPVGGQTDAIVARLRGRPDLVQRELVTALDDWALTLRGLKTDPGRLGAVLGLARALDPDPQRDRLRADLGRPDLRASRETLRTLARSADLPAATALLLAELLNQVDEKTTAIATLRVAAMRYPQEPWIHYELAQRLRQQSPSRTEEAIGYYSVARALRPELAFDLGATLRGTGRLPEALAVLRDLVQLRPEVSSFRIELAVALSDQGEDAEAATTLGEAVELARRDVLLRPEDEVAHHNLGIALENQGKQDEALAEFRETARLRPDVAGWHWNLGQRLLFRRNSEALAAFRVALRLEPDDRETQELVRECERFVRLEVRLPALLTGSDRPADAGERIDLAKLCYPQGLFRASARFSAEAFAEKPALAEDLSSSARYNAACSAALAGCGHGKDDPPADEAARVVLRRQALDWLRSDLAAWVKVHKDGPPDDRKNVVPTLRHWKSDADLAGLRDEAKLAKLPQAERDACRKLWAEVDERLKAASD